MCQARAENTACFSSNKATNFLNIYVYRSSAFMHAWHTHSTSKTHKGKCAQELSNNQLLASMMSHPVCIKPELSSVCIIPQDLE